MLRSTSEKRLKVWREVQLTKKLIGFDVKDIEENLDDFRVNGNDTNGTQVKRNTFLTKKRKINESKKDSDTSNPVEPGGNDSILFEVEKNSFSQIQSLNLEVNGSRIDLESLTYNPPDYVSRRSVRAIADKPPTQVRYDEVQFMTDALSKTNKVRQSCKEAHKMADADR